MRTLCGDPFRSMARAYNAGLGFYAFLRFHVDSTKFRRWNMDPAVAAECPPIVQPEDIAIGRPAAAAAGRRTTAAADTPSAAAPAAPAPPPTPDAKPSSSADSHSLVLPMCNTISPGR